MALLPKPPQAPGNPNDKVQHMLAFAVLACLASRAYYRTSLLKIWLGLAGVGALIEVLRAIPALNRDASFVNFFADCLAAGVVLLILQLREREAY